MLKRRRLYLLAGALAPAFAVVAWWVFASGPEESVSLSFAGYGDADHPSKWMKYFPHAPEQSGMFAFIRVSNLCSTSVRISPTASLAGTRIFDHLPPIPDDLKPTLLASTILKSGESVLVEVFVGANSGPWRTGVICEPLDLRWRINRRLDSITNPTARKWLWRIKPKPSITVATLGPITDRPLVELFEAIAPSPNTR